MSYEIVYAREFLKTKDGRIIPLVLMGSNNCWTRTYTGRDRRERHWLALLSRSGESPAMTVEELLKRVYKCIPSEYQEHFVRNGKLVAGRLYATGLTEHAKQFAKKKEAERWIKDRNLEGRFRRYTFEIEYVA